MSDPHKKPPRKIDTNEIIPTLTALAKLAARASTPILDIVIHQGRLGWRDHNKPHSHKPTIETFHTKDLICETMTFETNTKINRVRSAIFAHNQNEGE